MRLSRLKDKDANAAVSWSVPIFGVHIGKNIGPNLAAPEIMGQELQLGHLPIMTCVAWSLNASGLSIRLPLSRLPLSSLQQ